jgi:6-phosphogluconolactonase
MGKKMLAFIGSYAESSHPGLYACSYDAETGSFRLLDQVAGLQNPTFLDVDADRRKLYAIAEGADAEGRSCGVVTAFDIEPSSGRLTLLNKENSVPAPTCHITLDHTKQCVMVSSYRGGMVGLSPVLGNGCIGTTEDIHRHKGSSILPVQDRPHAHSVFVDRGNRYAAVCDLGLDRIFLYKLDVSGRRLIPHGEVSVAPGSGPRHFAFHPSLGYGYAINELGATITAFTYDEVKGDLREIQTVSTLPESYQGEKSCADIHISPDGKFLYGSNRGHDSIVVFAIDPSTGKLELVEHTSTRGGHPRNFAISPDGRFLLVANRDSDNIVTFARDASTGKLIPTGSELKLSKPVCIKFAEFEVE